MMFWTTFSAAHANRIVGALRIAITLGIAYTLADTAVYFVSDAHRGEPLPAGDVRAERGPAAIEGIVAANLFGRVNASTINRSEMTMQAPDSKLDLILEGVFQAKDPQLSAAIVAEKSKPGQLYAIGATVYGNAMLARVSEDHIVLRRAGSLETLRFPDVRDSGASSTVDNSGSATPADAIESADTSYEPTYDPSRDEQPPPLESPPATPDDEVANNG